MNKKFKDMIIIGFALFAMFFGAGNLIFPPYLGKAVGSQFFIASIGFIITGVGLPFLGILACTKTHGSFEIMAKPMGKTFSIICTTALILAIGPMLAIPRTAATTHELSIRPLFPSMPSIISMIIYFAINLIFILRPSKIIDNIGKYLTPILLITLLTIIIKGIVSPIGNVVDTGATLVFPNALKEGYQTMDALASVIFASIVTTAVIERGYKDKQIISMTIKSGFVAIIGLAIVYGGLMYLGSQTSVIIPEDLSKTELLLQISKRTLGNLGSIFIGIAIGLACLTTSIGLISSAASFFQGLSGGRLSYNLNAFIISAISILIGNFGVDKIVTIAVPILSILYPVVISLILLTLGKNFIKDARVTRFTTYTALIFSVISVLPSLGINSILINNIISVIPLGTSGFLWLTPSLIVFIAALILTSKKNIVNN